MYSCQAGLQILPSCQSNSNFWHRLALWGRSIGVLLGIPIGHGSVSPSLEQIVNNFVIEEEQRRTASSTQEVIFEVRGGHRLLVQ